jgi:DnaJ-domain-containing protein 1
MSIGKRLIDLARSELNSLLDKAARVDGDEADDRERRRYGSEYGSMSDKELDEEIERRRQAREEVEQATNRNYRPEAGPSSRTSSAPPRRTAAGDEAIRRAYAALEVPAGSDLEIVKRAYRRLMRKYHPDLNAGSSEKQRAATDLSQRLTEAYKTLERHLRR